jgi:acetyl-CoA carboxylase biotin carboxyl carrier protein
MTVDDIRELINLARETGVAELEVQRADNRVRIRLAGFSAQHDIMAAPQPFPAAGAVAETPSGPEPSQQSKPADPNLTLVTAPIVGTFYEAPSPDAPPFVRIGEHVQPGKVLCIIEAMKLMNEIVAETTGVVESKLVMNGQPVEYGEALFAVRKV